MHKLNHLGLVWALLQMAAVPLLLREYDSFQVGAYPDDTRYIILSRSLLYSDQYGIISGPGEPLRPPYPFAYPMLIAPFVVLFPSQIDAPKVLSLAATFLNSAIIFWGWRTLSPRHGASWGLVVSTLYLFSPQAVRLSRQVMSDPVFLTATLASVILTERLARHESRLSLPSVLALGLGLALVFSTRTIGLMLVLTSCGYLVMRSRGRGVVAASAAVAAMLGLITLFIVISPVAFTDLVPRQYLRQTTDLTVQYDEEQPEDDGGGETILEARASVWRAYLMTHVRHVLFPIGGGQAEEEFVRQYSLTLVRTLIAGGIIVAVALGYWRWARADGWSLFSVWLLVYGATIMAWPWEDERYLYPILPQLYLAFLVGALWVAQWISARVLRQCRWERRTWLLLSPVLFVMALTFLYRDFRIDDTRIHVGDLKLRTAWIRANSEPHDILITEEPEIDYVYGDRKTVRLEADSVKQLGGLICESGARYVLLAPAHRWYDVEFVPSYTKRTERAVGMLPEFELRNLGREVHADPSTLIRVFRVERTGPQCAELFSWGVPHDEFSAEHGQGRLDAE